MTVAEPVCASVRECVRVLVLYESVCVESRGESRRGFVDISVAVWEGKAFAFFLLFVSQLGGSCGLFLYNPCKMVEMRWGKDVKECVAAWRATQRSIFRV